MSGRRTPRDGLRVDRVRELAAVLQRAGVVMHAGALLVLLLALAPVMDIEGTFSPDEGVYGLQVQALEAGSWEFVPPSAAIDPSLEFSPYRGIPSGDGLVLYDRHPAYPLLLQGFSTALGGIDAALLATGIAGVVAAAVAAWHLGAAMRVGSERMAFWLTVASPVLLHGYILWAHAPAVAAAAWAMVLLIRATRRREALAWAGSACLLVAGALLRSESVLLAVALVVATGVGAAAWRRPDLLLGAAGLALAVAVAVLLERRAIGGITDVAHQGLSVRGSGSPVGRDPGYLRGRLEGLRQTLLDGASFNDRRSGVARGGVVLMVAGSVFAVRRGRSAVAAAGLAVGAALFAVRVVATPEDPVPGLLVAWPVAIVGISAAWLRRREHDEAIALVLAGALAAFVAVLATQYAVGAATNWGGRFYTMFVPLLAALAASSWRPDWLLERRAWNQGLVAVALLTTIASLSSVRAVRSSFAEVSGAVASVDAPVAMSPVRSVPQALWRDDQVWMGIATDELDDALDLVGSRGVETVALVWPRDLPVHSGSWRADAVGDVASTTMALRVYRLRSP